jgi:hypothetical protein
MFAVLGVRGWYAAVSVVGVFA